MDTADKLGDLRERVLEQLLQILETGGAPAEERFQFALQLADAKGSPEFYQKAFDIAQVLEGESKLTAHYDLLARIDTQLQDDIADEPTHEAEAVSSDTQNPAA